MDYFMRKAGKQIGESFEVSITKDEDHNPVVKIFSSNSKDLAKSKVSDIGVSSVAKEAMARIFDEQKKQERDTKLQEIIEQLKEQLKQTLGTDASDLDGTDSDFDDYSEKDNN